LQRYSLAARTDLATVLGINLGSRITIARLPRFAVPEIISDCQIWSRID
jgi:hypothetical protein